MKGTQSVMYSNLTTKMQLHQAIRSKVVRVGREGASGSSYQIDFVSFQKLDPRFGICDLAEKFCCCL